VATHHAAGSWKSVDSYRKGVKLAEQRNFELRGQIESLEKELEATKARLARAEARSGGGRGLFARAFGR